MAIKKLIVTVIVFLALFSFDKKMLFPQEYSLAQDEAAAQAFIIRIGASIAIFAQSHDFKMPDSLDVLVKSRPAYLDKYFTKTENNGYRYNVELYPSAFKITAVPIECGVTGNKIFVLQGSSEEIKMQIEKAKNGDGAGIDNNSQIQKYPCN
jgi:hypothetical protein